MQLGGNSQACRIILFEVFHLKFKRQSFLTAILFFKHIIKTYDSMKWKEAITESQYLIVLILKLSTVITVCMFKAVCKN